jgi:hypothetical protein
VQQQQSFQFGFKASGQFSTLKKQSWRWKAALTKKKKKKKKYQE